MSPIQPSRGRSVGYWCVCIAALFLGGCGISSPLGVSVLADESFFPKWAFAVHFEVFVRVAIWIVQLVGVVISLWRGRRDILAAACMGCIFGQLVGAVLCLTKLADPEYHSIYKCVSCGPEIANQLLQQDIQVQATFVVVITAVVVVGLTGIVIYLGASKAPARGEPEDVSSNPAKRGPQLSSNPYASPES